MIIKLLFSLLLSFAAFFILSQQKLLLEIKTPLLSLSSFNVINPQNTFLPNRPTIDSIFKNDHTWVATLSAEHIRKIIATGDIIPARSVNYQTVSRQNFKWPYLNIAELIKNADIAFINLESPLINGCPITQEGMIFCGDAKNVEGLIYAGIDVVNLANNHAGNYGVPNVKQTINLLNQSGILTTGTGGSTIKEVNGIKFAFLGYNDVAKPQPGISNADEEIIKKEIREAKTLADIAIVAFHWGTEYKDQPNERQINLGHLAIDSGADLVIGNHPHWIQPIEFYKNKLITYAHGNLIFDQMWSQKTKEGIIGRYTFYDKQLIDVEYFPIQIENYGQPSFINNEKSRMILEEIKIKSTN